MSQAITDKPFRSILWPRQSPEGDATAPGCLHDLNLDQVFAAMDSAWPEENLKPFFHAHLEQHADIEWRQAIVRDLEDAPVRQTLMHFVEGMREVRGTLASAAKLYYPVERQRAHLDAADIYARTVQELTAKLGATEVASSAMQSLQAWLRAHLAGSDFAQLVDDTRTTLAALDAVRYELMIRGGNVTVRPRSDNTDVSADIAATFARFRPDEQTTESSTARARTHGNGLDHIEAQIVEKLALLQPKPFATLDKFCTEHADFVAPTLALLAREVCFYLAWLANIRPLQAADLPFCFPQLAEPGTGPNASQVYDLALASKLAAAKEPVVCNDFELHADERMLVITGPNHGGKTTFARMFGQLHWLAALGLTVPGEQAQLPTFDHLLTHFERAEDVTSLRGKLKDDLVRIHAILEQATPRSLIVMNEIFSSTTLDDAVLLGRRIMQRIDQLGALSVYVTFMTELADFNGHTVSMVSEVDPDDPAIRTFKLTRRAADGLAYALAVANKYRVTQPSLLRRIAP